MNTYKVASKWVIMCKHWSKHKHTHRNAPYKIETQGQNQRRAKMYTFDWWYCERIGSVDAELQTCTSIIPMRYVGKYCTWTNITLNDIDTKVCTNKNTFSQSRFRFCFDVFVGRCLCAFFLSLHIYIYILDRLFPTGNILIYLYRVYVATATHFGCCVCTNPCQFQKSNYLRLIADISFQWCGATLDDSHEHCFSLSLSVHLSHILFLSVCLSFVALKNHI